VAEARRVLCPGGRIVLVGQDWDTIMVDSDDAALTRTIVHARADILSTPRAGRQYRNLPGSSKPSAGRRSACPRCAAGSANRPAGPGPA
jgi:hypothetical protein